MTIGLFVGLTVAVIIVTVAACRLSMVVDLGAAIISEERHKQQAEHVERCNERSDEADQPEHPLPCSLEKRSSKESRLCSRSPRMAECRRSATVAIAMVAKVTGMYERRPPILRMSCSPPTGMDHRACSQKEQAFEERVRHQVENAGGEEKEAPTPQAMNI